MPTSEVIMEKNISDSAKIAFGVKYGHNCIIMNDVEIGKNSLLGNNIIIYEGTIIGKNTRIDDNTIIGKSPMISPRSILKSDNRNLKPAVIGDNNIIGSNVIIYKQCEMGDFNLIADLATIRENVDIGDYNIIGRGVAIENFVSIGQRNKIETNCYITAYSRIEDYCFIAPAVATSNDNYMGRDEERFKHFKGVTVKTGGRIGVNATILPGIIIESDAMISGGSLVSKNTSAGDIWMGIPARKIRKVPETQLLKNNLDKE